MVCSKVGQVLTLATDGAADITGIIKSINTCASNGGHIRSRKT